MSSNNFYFARQPILDRKGKIYAYELLYRSSMLNQAGEIPKNATEQVLVNAMNFAGLDDLIGRGSKAFINIDEQMLFSSVLESIPKEHFILELLESIKFTPKITSRVEQLHRSGYLFALDDIICTKVVIDSIMPLLPFVAVIKLDPPESIEIYKRYVALFKKMGIYVLAEKVETREEHDTFHAIGCDLFQGYYFAKPIIVSGKKIDTSAARLIEILALLNDQNIKKALHLFEQDAALTLQLLRYMNSAAFSFRTDINSVRHAVTLLGSGYLKQWLTLMTYARGSKNGLESPLLFLAQDRASMMELLTAEIIGKQSREQANLIGLLSLIDSLFQRPMEELLQEVHVDESITNILLHRSNSDMSKVYRLVIALERLDNKSIDRLLAELGFDRRRLATTMQQCYEITERSQKSLEA